MGLVVLCGQHECVVVALSVSTSRSCHAGRVILRQPALRPGLVDEAAPSMLVVVGVLHYMKPSSSVSRACRPLM